MKNSLQLVASMFSLQATATQNTGFAQGLQGAGGRVTSIARIHERLYRTSLSALFELGAVSNRCAGGFHRPAVCVIFLAGSNVEVSMHVWVQELAEHRLPILRRSRRWGWVTGLGLFAIAFLLRWALEGVLPAGLPFITFFIAILLATLVGGAPVGLTVLALSFVASWYFFINPRFSFGLEGSGIAALLVFALFGGAIAAISHELNVMVERLLAERRRSNDLLVQSARAEEKLAQLNRELLHRIRNIFTLATSIASHTSRYAATPSEMAGALTSRFQALAVAQELLVANELAGADLRQLAADTLKPLVPNNDRLGLTGPPVRLSPDSTTSVCLVLHELATNAVKHGAWSNSRGVVDLEWSLAPNSGVDPLVTMRWRETGGPPCAAPGRAGLGTLLIDNAVSGAVVERNFLPEGLHCSVQFTQPSLGST